MKKIEVVAAIIKNEDAVLCCQRGESKLPYIHKKWEFPGGKIEDGETKEEALKREIQEELNMAISELDFFLTVVHEYPDFILTMHAFKAKTSVLDPKLNEHLDSRWLSIDQLTSLDWAEADIPIIQKLMQDYQ